MPDSKLADLTAAGALGGDELLYVVDNPATTPVDRKITVADLPSGFRPWIPGRWRGPAGGLIRTILGSAAGYLYYQPIVLDVPGSTDALGLDINAGVAASTATLALFDTVDGRPSARVALTGALDTSTAGEKVGLLGASVSLPAGLYWQSVLFLGGNPTMWGYSAATSDFVITNTPRTAGSYTDGPGKTVMPASAGLPAAPAESTAIMSMHVRAV